MVRAAAWIIPARAGFTTGPVLGGSRLWDHPRSRGVYAAGQDGAQPISRIIPARAGFTGRMDKAEAETADHPRSRGVYTTDDGEDR